MLKSLKIKSCPKCGCSEIDTMTVYPCTKGTVKGEYLEFTCGIGFRFWPGSNEDKPYKTMMCRAEDDFHTKIHKREKLNEKIYKIIHKADVDDEHKQNLIRVLRHQV